MFNVHALDSDYEPRISYYADDSMVDGLPTLWDAPAVGRTKVAVFRLNDGTVLITSDPEAVEFAEEYC